MVSYFDHYHSDVIPDHEWIEYAASAGFVALTRDNRIRSDSIAIRAVMENHGRLFIVRGELIASERAAMFLSALPSVTRALERQSPNPFIANLRRESRTSGSVCLAKVMLTYEAWQIRGKPVGGSLQEPIPRRILVQRNLTYAELLAAGLQVVEGRFPVVAQSWR